MEQAHPAKKSARAKSDKKVITAASTNNKPKDGLKRKLQARHITMISLGGTIGTGLFLASGNAIHTAGPGGALIAYGLVGIMVFFLMTSLAEMAAYMPIAGSFSVYSSKFVDESLGFAMGWNYWYSWAVTIAAELSAVGLVMKYWFPDIPTILWSAICLAILFFINILSVKSFGESEYWFALIKVITVIIFIITGILMIAGIMGGDSIGVKNFTVADAPIHGGFFSVLGIFMAAGFSFQGTELLGVTAGESKNPEKHVPKAVKQVFWRILLFYILTITVIGLIIPYTTPELAASDDVTVSPFTLVFEKVGFAFATSVMNSIILTAILSAGNSGMYAAARMLWNMAKEGHAPKALGKVNSKGIPVNALILTSLVGCLAFLSSLFGDGEVYTWLLNAAGLSGFIAWLGIALSHYRFRRAFVIQKKSMDELPYKAKWFPFGPLFAFTLCAIIIIGQNYSAFTGGAIDWRGILVSYVSLPIFIVLWLGYKFLRKTKVVKLSDCILEKGK
ncbi:amino acid permease [Peribacillus sp. B-H-3]|uniref:amino acid permease n=1 Tax=Peribacillus sp. B-H-3 TaxID=3400420 RepID=UPI003B02DCAA